MGPVDGDSGGLCDGITVGDEEGIVVGPVDGDSDGLCDGITVGDEEGIVVGTSDSDGLCDEFVGAVPVESVPQIISN